MSVGALSLGIALGGCGGSTTSKSSESQAGGGPGPQSAQSVAAAKSQKPHQTPAASNADIGQAHAQLAPTRHSARGVQHVGSGSAGKAPSRNRDRLVPTGRVQKAANPPGTASDDVSSTGASPLNPCTLVSVSEARVITGGAIAGQTEAPLGPTCIYRGTHTQRDITLAVESMKIAQVTRQLEKRTSVTVGGRVSYCGRLGSPMLFVPLPGGHLLNVTAPCGIAERFAQLAVSRIES